MLGIVVVVSSVQGPAGGEGNSVGGRGEPEIGGKEPRLEPAEGVPREGLEHDDPGNEAHPHAAAEPRRKGQEVEQQDAVCAAAAATASRGAPAASDQDGDQNGGAEDLCVARGCCSGHVGHVGVVVYIVCSSN